MSADREWAIMRTYRGSVIANFNLRFAHSVNWFVALPAIYDSIVGCEFIQILDEDWYIAKSAIVYDAALNLCSAKRLAVWWSEKI